MKQELQEFDDNSWSISIIKDYIDQLQDLKRHLNQIQAMEEVEMSFPDLMDTIVDEDGGTVTSSFTLQEWILYKKMNLLSRKDKLEVANREDETKQKMLLQDALRSSNRQKIQKLQMFSYQKVCVHQLQSFIQALHHIREVTRRGH